MCGIAGLHGPQDEASIDAMSRLLVHRGPDDSGVFRDAEHGLTLGMQRLAIIDIASGHQPMTTPDGRFTIVYNGEIYNAPELRRELVAQGVAFATDHSDTEVLLNLYARRGAEALPRLNGMFAFAVFDRVEGTLFCARDRLGIKPFYYAAAPGRFAFASELKSLLALPWLERTLDAESLYHYMSLMYVPGTATILESVKRLPAAHALTYRLRDGAVLVSRWWQPRLSTGTARPRSGWRSMIRGALERAVDRWSLSDVPIGCSLSGGLDSSTIVALLARAGHDVRTYSLGFTGAGEASWNELPLARLVAEKWRTQHHELVLDPEALLEDLLAMVWHLDEPYGGGLPSWTVFKFMSREVKVGLTGTGGDELFGNYGKWRELEGGWLRRRLPGTVTRERFEQEFFDRYYYAEDAEKADAVVAERVRPARTTAELLWARFQSASATCPRDGCALTDLETQLPEEFLQMTDRFSMAHSLEARTPFLDHELVELVLSIPAADRTARGDLKGLLRETVADLLPAELLAAPKRGFVIPLTLWLRQQLRPLAERLLAPERLREQGLFRPEFHARYVRPHLDGTADHTNKVWAALMFQLWHHLFIERSGSEPPTHDWRALLQ